MLILLLLLIVVFGLRVLFDVGVMHKRLHLRISQKLFSTALFSNALALIVTATFSMPFMDRSIILFMIQMLFVLGVEAPIYQIAFRNRSWRSCATSLLISRFLFTFLATVIGIVIMYSMGIDLPVA